MARFVELLYEALDTPLGIVVRTSDPERLRSALYAARREAMNPEFSALTIQPSKVDPRSELWIVRRQGPPANGRPQI